jgi:hypothetical protein
MPVNHNLRALDYLRDHAPDLETILEDYAREYDTGHPEHRGTRESAKDLAVEIVEGLILDLQYFLDDLKKADLKHF